MVPHSIRNRQEVELVGIFLRNIGCFQLDVDIKGSSARAHHHVIQEYPSLFFSDVRSTEFLGDNAAQAVLHHTAQKNDCYDVWHCYNNIRKVYNIIIRDEILYYIRRLLS